MIGTSPISLADLGREGASFPCAAAELQRKQHLDFFRHSQAAILSLQRYPAGSWAFQPANGHEWKHYTVLGTTLRSKRARVETLHCAGATNWERNGFSRFLGRVRRGRRQVCTPAGIGRVRWSEYHSDLRRPALPVASVGTAILGLHRDVAGSWAFRPTAAGIGRWSEYHSDLRRPAAGIGRWSEYHSDLRRPALLVASVGTAILGLHRDVAGSWAFR